MKTQTLLFLCLVLGFGLTQLSAQDVYPPLPPENHNGTGSISSWSSLVDNYYYIPVFSSNGDEIDWLSGDVTIHTIDNFKNGVWISRKIDYSGDITSVGVGFSGGTGEVFSIKDIWKYDPGGAMGPGHINARGNQGSHYLINYIYDDYASFIFVSAVWPGYKE